MLSGALLCPGLLSSQTHADTNVNHQTTLLSIPLSPNPHHLSPPSAQSQHTPHRGGTGETGAHSSHECEQAINWLETDSLPSPTSNRYNSESLCLLTEDIPPFVGLHIKGDGRCHIMPSQRGHTRSYTILCITHRYRNIYHFYVFTPRPKSNLSKTFMIITYLHEE